MRAGRGGGGGRKQFRAASESQPKTGEMEVKSESFTPPGIAVATYRAGGGGGGRGEEEERVEESSPLALSVT